MSMADAFAPYEAVHRARVLYATFGHLYPKPGFRYKGRFRFVVSGYGGDCCILASDWGDLPDSPDLYETMMDVFDDYRIKSRSKHAIMNAVRHDVFEWAGELICYKNGKTRLTKGKIRTILRTEY